MTTIRLKLRQFFNLPDVSSVLRLKGTVPLRKARHFDSGIVLLGASYCRPFSVEERFLVNDDSLYGPVDEGEQAEFFTKAIVAGKVLHCQQYTRRSRRKNSIVGLVQGRR